MDEAGVERVIVVPPTLTGHRNDYGSRRRNDIQPLRLMGRFPSTIREGRSPAALERAARHARHPRVVQHADTALGQERTADCSARRGEGRRAGDVSCAGDLAHFAASPSATRS